jgi:hydrogenase nickel incorporation protein HypA/HybF
LLRLYSGFRYMHELRVAFEVINLVQAEAKRLNLRRVSDIGLRLGALSGVNREALKFSFEAAVSGGPLANTSVSIEDVPVRARCARCDREFEVQDFEFVCPHCASTDVEVIAGEELEISYLTGEQ